MDELDRRLLLGTAGLAGLAAFAAGTRAGPINPPAGPVGSSGRTMLEIEPRTPIGPTTTPGDATSLYRITQPGSYYLTGNALGVAGKHGIVVAASGVTIDLMGFELRGAGAGASAVYSGVRYESNAVKQVCVCNGQINNWERAGVDLLEQSVIRNVSLSGNGYQGISVQTSSEISECVVAGSVYGIVPGGWGCRVNRCAVKDSTNAGFFAAQGTVLSACTATGCATGVAAGAAVLVDCTAAVNTGAGFNCGLLSTVTRCNAYNNQGVGFVCDTGTAVLDCTAASNFLHGITATSECQLRGNTCSGNGLGAQTGYGILVTGSRCRVEANHCAHNEQGINVSGTGNLIIRNSVAGNLGNGYTVAAGNMFGPNVYPASNLINTGSNPHANYEM